MLKSYLLVFLEFGIIRQPILVNFVAVVVDELVLVENEFVALWSNLNDDGGNESLARHHLHLLE